ncbi:MAG: YceI family protein [Candidatus Kapaibacterium sp.]|jgi:polyisoprenoid-binding protein YceI
MSTTTLEQPISAPVAANTSDESVWTLDAAHSAAHFSVKHMMIANVRGSFDKIEGSLHLNTKDITKSHLEAVLEVASVNTGIADRDGHLKGPDFFDVENFPKISFKSTAIKSVGKDELELHGDLTIRDVTKNVILQVEGPSAEMKDPWGNTKIALSGTTKLNRKDFGLVYNAILETGGVMVGETVTLTIDAEFSKVAVPALN